MKTRRGHAGRGLDRKARPKARPNLERMEDRLLMTVFVVTSNSDNAAATAGDGTLRGEILESNASTTQLPNILQFNLPPGQQQIQPVASLPPITQPVTIDGTTQPGFSKTNPRPLIEINGSSPLLGAGPGLVASTGGVNIIALTIDKFNGDGIQLNGGSGKVQGCYIGLTPMGTVLSKNTGTGIKVASAGNTIGGVIDATTLFQRNVISGNNVGILISGGGAGNNVVEGNFIGTDATGLSKLGETFDCIDVNTAKNTIGGVTTILNGAIAGAGNVLDGGFAGINVSTFSSGQADGNVIQGNFIGVDKTGNGGLGNVFDGIDLSNTRMTRIGGNNPGEGNVISDNGFNGIQLSDAKSFGNRIQGNTIGTGLNQVTPLGNGSNGIYINGVSGTTIGGTVLSGSDPSFGNIIAYSGRTFGMTSDGVLVNQGTSNGILSNRIFNSSNLGIALTNGGNQGTPAPTLKSVQSGAAQTRIIGTFAGNPSTAYRLQFFSNTTPNPMGGEGQQFLGDLDVMTNSSGVADFSTVLMQGVPVGNYVSSTATQGVLNLNNTSQFGPDVQATQAQVTDLAVTSQLPKDSTGATIPPALNQPYTFTVTATNNGPNAATGVVVTDTLPTDATFVSSTGGTVSGGTLTDDIGSLASGASVTISITVRPNTVSGTFSNTATINGDQLDVNLTNNTTTTPPATVVSNADLSVGLTVSQNPAPVGSPITYTLVLGNNGPSTANNVMATVNLPSTLTDVVVTPDQGSFTLDANNVLTINSGTIPASTNSTITITGTPTATGPTNTTASVSSTLFDPNMANNMVSLPVTIANAADLGITVTGSPNPVLIGQSLVYTIVVTNNGPSTATQPVVFDTLPSSVNFDAANSNAGPNGVLSSGNGTVTATLQPIAAGASDTITIAVTPTVSGQVTNTVNVGDPSAANPAEIDPDTSNNTATTTTQVSPADLAVVINNPTDPLLIGVQAAFQVVITNNGPATATNVILNESFGPGATIVSTSAGTIKPSAAGDSISANLGSLASGASTTVTILVNPSRSGTLTDSATISAIEFDPETGNNTSSSTNLVSPVDLAVTTAGSPTSLLVGGVATYVITVTNNGPATATNVIFNDLLPSGATLEGATSSQGAVAPASDTTVTGNLGSLAPGASATVTIAVTPAFLGTVTNTASVTSDDFDTNSANNTASASINVFDQPGTIQFDSPLAIVAESGGSVTLTLNRVGGTLGTVSVDYATSNFTAVAGTNFTASSGTVTFFPGQTTATITIPITDVFLFGGSDAFFVTLSNPGGGATLGPDSVSAVLIANTDIDPVAPAVIGFAAIPNGSSINGFVITFNKPLDPARASLASNYQVFLSNRDSGGRGETPIPLSAAFYNPANNTVTLIPPSPLPGNRFYHVIVNGSFGQAITSASGIPLAGGAGPNSNYDVFFGQGTSLRYADSHQNAVTIDLKGGGLLRIFRAANGDASVIDLVGINPGKSKLSGSVKKLTRRASGQTTIGAINGFGRFGQVKSSLTTPSFFVVSAPVQAAAIGSTDPLRAASIVGPGVTVGRKTPRGLFGVR